jgi:hypothetical protein
MSVATEDKLMTLIVVYLTFGSVEGIDSRTSWTSYQCAFQLLRKWPDRTAPAKTSWALSAIIYARSTAQVAAVFTSLNTAALPCSVPTVSFNIHRYKKDQLLPLRKHSVSITKSNWLLLFTQMFILRIIQRNTQMHCVIAFGFLTPKDGTDRLSHNVGKKLPLLVA